MVNLIIPDRWQQDAVNALREGKDLVVHAPTGAGKTYIFELFYDSIKGQAVYTVPTRALANDKLAEWKARGWDVGISTGDVAENLNARVVVATLETQKSRFLRRDGPRLLVVDEYQLLADPVRGMNYELILSLAPPETQILLLSGSVANPEDVASWLERIGRNVEVIIHRDRPVPLEEIMLNDIPIQAPACVRSLWPRLITRALLADMGPILIFAPRRKAAEELAQTLSAALSNDEPLSLSNEQALAAGEPLAKLLRHRIAYHHSGLSYAVRAGLIEPLAKRGQLRVVVATMGLAAGINFSMRSVLITGAHYLVNNFRRQVRPDELLQMFGRAGRRGLDEVGFALVTPDVPRLHEAYPLKLKRAEPIDWPSFIAVMHAATCRGTDPFAEAVQLSRRLFTPKELTIGVERFYQTGTRPCGLRVDVERGRFVRRERTEMLNSRGEWEISEKHGRATLAQLWVRRADGRWRPALSVAASLSGVGIGNLCKFKSKDGVEYGREIAVAIRRDSEWHLLKWLRRLLKERFPLLQVPGLVPEIVFRTVLLPILSRHVGGDFAEFSFRDHLVLARFKFGRTEAEGYLEKSGRWLKEPITRKNYPAICENCTYRGECESIDLAPTPAFAWRKLGLIDELGSPTRRGVIFSFFSQGEGLVIAAALEQDEYLVDDLVFDLANLRAGHRFARDEAVFGGRLGYVCQQTYGRLDIPGYLEMGVPPAYGAGASEVIRDVVEQQVPRSKLLTDLLRPGDIERAITEWRSLLRQLVQAPDYPWSRWRELREISVKFVSSTQSPTKQVLPTLLPNQLKRYQPKPSSFLSRVSDR